MKLNHFLAAALAGVATFCQAQNAPAGLTFQGRLTTLAGQPVPNGTAKVRVRIFDAPSGGTRLWTSGEGPGQELSVPVRNGVFSTILSQGFNSSNNPLTIGPTVFQGGVIYVEVAPLNQPPIVPRTQIWSAPWAFWAQTVPDGAITTDKLSDGAITSSKLAADHDSLNKISDGWLFSTVNGVGINKTPSGNAVLALRGTLNSGFSKGISFADFVGTERYLIDILNGGLSFREPSMTTPTILFTPTGNVGIGTTTPQSKLEVNGDVKIGGVLKWDPNGDTEETSVYAGGVVFNQGSGQNHYAGIYWGTQPGQYSGTRIVSPYPGQPVIDFYSTFNPSAWCRLRADSFEVHSSRRYKKNISPLEGGLSVITNLRPVTYAYRTESDKTTRVGLIAEEAAQVAKPIVGFKPDGKTPDSIDYSKLTPYLIKAVQEQQVLIEKQSRELRELRDEVSRLARTVKKQNN